ncbi:proteasome stabiliser-domain-containing protein [Fimicolochytrium jonesii]|uniref:proteasome stabiliser-domain-containing protein n=1 Tax=Fimicolochytrium jonesii TaxID=1396493 RepID=UPI0022FE6081|nr:proteasome stabiliser-domain-containing protein [Fimicolochytrium jonesii]KAI8818240.1 proteasome stabiliser-domain-containing protein [Fimicolochytrium jonesii]
MSLCSHVSKRFKSDPTLSLPMSALFDLWEAESTTMIVRNFCLIYLEIGFNRITDEEKIKCLPRLLRNISRCMPAQQAAIMQMALHIIGTLTRTRNPVLDPSVDWHIPPADIRFFLEKLADLMLYAPAPKTTAVTLGNRPPNAPPLDVPPTFVPPAMSKEEITFITNNNKASWTSSLTESNNMKLSVLRFLALPGLIPQDEFHWERYHVYLAAAGDANHELISAGEDGMKRYAQPDLENANVVRALYAMYQGKPSNNPDSHRSPATPSLKNRILRVLLKSATAANTFPNMIQVAFDALNGETTTPKLRASGMSFVQWIARMTKDETIKPIAPILLTALLQFIERTKSGSPSAENDSLRGFAFEAVGLVAKRAPDVFDVSVLRELFASLMVESASVQVSVLDALSNMSNAYQKMLSQDPSKETEFKELLLGNVSNTNHRSRYITAKYANALFPYKSALARYIDVILSQDSKPEVRDESLKGLVFPEADNCASDDLPVFGDVLALVSSNIEKNPKSFAQKAHVRQDGTLHPVVLADFLKYFRHLLILRANPKCVLGRKGLDDFEDIADVETRDALVAVLAQMSADTETSGLRAYTDLLTFALQVDSGELQAAASYCLLELISFGPPAIGATYISQIEWIKSFIVATRAETRISMSHVLGLVVTTQLDDPMQVKFVSELLVEFQKTAQDKQTSPEQRHGATLALGYIVGRSSYRYSKSPLPSDILSRSLEVIVKQLDAGTNLEILGACEALSEAGRYSALPRSSTLAPDEVIRKLIALMSKSSSNNDTKIHEQAISAMGQLANGDHGLSKQVFDHIYTLASSHSKQTEVHFTIGEAITAATCGFVATHMQKYLDIPTVTVESKAPAETVQEVINTLLEKIAPGSAPVVRKNLAIWLLCIIRLGGKHPVVKANALRLQSAFAGLLGETDEFTQEVASRGMGLVFELGDEAVRSQLVGSLVSTLTEGKKIAPQSVTGETQLFRDNALGSAPEGGQVSGTYQSILSLASDMNQPDLVYKFMSLAAHNAVWNSRRGASMGFSTIATQATKELEPHLPAIIPKLYRFQFDPNPKVAESMKNIWQTLIKEPSKTLDDYFETIMKDLLAGLGDRQWRLREASCLALADLTSSREMKQLEPHLEEMWLMCFRALDDIKESVRTAAFRTCKALTNKTVRYCDPTTEAVDEGRKVMRIVVPFFLTKGLQSSAEDVRNFSLATILKICKKGGFLLKPHVTELVATLLECLATMEPQVLNYLTFHTDKYNISQEQLENSRLSAVRSSPIMDAIESCIDQVDGEVLKALIPRLNGLIRKGVGLPTKAGSARIVYSLVQRAPNDLKEHADSLLKALKSAIFDRSIVVQKAFASAIGHLAKVCSDGAVEQLLTSMIDIYLQTDDPDKRPIPGYIFLEFAKKSSDKAKEFQGRVLPIAYLGARDDTDAIKLVWVDVWEEMTGGSAGAIRLWMKEMMGMMDGLLASTPSWSVKKQVAMALGDMAKALRENFSPYMNEVVDMLISALAGRTWEGKEAIVNSLATVIVENKGWFATPEGAAKVDKITQILIQEAKKNNKPYKRHSIDSLGKAFDALNIDKYADLYDYLAELAAPEASDDMEVDDEDDQRQKTLGLLIRATSFKTLALCFPRNSPETQAKYAVPLCTLLTKNLDGNVWNVRLAVIEAFETFLDKLSSPSELLTPQVVSEAINQTINCLEDGKYTSVRTAAARMLHKLATTTLPLLPDSVRLEAVTKLDGLTGKELVPLVAEEIKKARKVLAAMDAS